MLELVGEIVGDLFGESLFARLFRRWDGKNVSQKGTIGCSFRLVSGSEPGLTTRWRSYQTVVSDRHLWIGRNSVDVTEVHIQQRRPPRVRDLLDADFAIVPVTTTTGARMEWAFRASQVAEVMKRLGSVSRH